MRQHCASAQECKDNVQRAAKEELCNTGFTFHSSFEDVLGKGDADSSFLPIVPVWKCVISLVVEARTCQLCVTVFMAG